MYDNLELGCACLVVAILLKLTTKHFRMLRGALRFFKHMHNIQEKYCHVDNRP